MAFSSSSSSSLSPNPIPYLPPLSSSSSSSPYPFLQTKRISSNSFRTLALRTSPSSSYQTIEVDNPKSHNPKALSPTPKKKQKQRPSFYDQVRDKWSLKIDLQRKKFPWEEKHQDEEEVSVEEEEEIYEEKGETPLLEKSVGFSLGNHLSSPPWLNRSNFEKTYFDSKDEIFNGEEVSEIWSKKGVVGIDENIEKQRIGRPSFSRSNFGKTLFDSKDEIVSEVWSKKGVLEIDENIEKQIIHRSNYKEKTGFGSQTKFEDGDEFGEFRNEMEEGVSDNEEFEEEEEEDERIESESLLGLIEEEKTDFSKEGIVGLLESSKKSSTIPLPWERSDLEATDGGRSRRNKAEVADKTIPEAELRRLRNISLRMMERIKVRAGGVTQSLVDRIHEKWKVEEVVKLKFEGPPGFNMKRTHETLESRTGGLVIWRSGSSVVLYRGMAYKLPCVQQYTNLSQAKDSTTDVVENVEMHNASKTQPTRAAKSHEDSSEELMKMADLNNLLEELGPRFIDWYGPEPVPVDADMLPSVVPGYKPPFRVLPYKVRPNLGNKRMTTYRRLARLSPPHFALGRNRELQGLAMAMVKLWKRNAIAKIAIKRGVLNTRNERMAEELKKLTGGTLLSRNKEYIVFYRGNDFLSPHVTEALLEREKSVEVQQEEEERARDRASTLFLSNVKTAKGQLVAGTLAETLAAKSRWGNDPSVEDMEKMKRDFVSAKHASLVRYLEKKIVRAQDKVNRAENALRRVQEFLTPSELPSDLETITDEERVVYRKMGLSMKAFLVVGRRDVFDGTVENMHLHWKHRELVKIIVRGRNFPQVKHIAISLEAESGGVLVSVDKTTQGYAIVFYRGKNYQRPETIRPKNLLTKRQALERSIELQRREALIHHISDIRKKVELLKSGLDQVEAAKEAGEEAPKMLNNAYFSDDDFEDEGEEAYLETYNDDEEVDETPNRRAHVRR